MATTRKGSALWMGTLKEGSGSVSTESGAIASQPYGFNTRFEDEPGTNPEELLGAAHAACFSMALSNELAQAEIGVTSIATTASVKLDQTDGGFEISAVHLDVKVEAPNADEDAFEKAANKAKENCPVSKLFNADITMDAELSA